MNEITSECNNIENQEIFESQKNISGKTSSL